MQHRAHLSGCTHPPDDVSIPTLPHLSLPNLVVAPRRESLTKTPPLPPPRRRGSTPAAQDEWEMKYTDLQLKGGLGWDNSGRVVQGILARDGERRKVFDRMTRLEMGQAGSSHQWIVAVKHIKGGPINEHKAEHCGCMHVLAGPCT